MSNITQTQIREAGKILEEKLPGTLFTLIVHDISNPETVNYVSSFNQVDHMVKALDETVKILKNSRNIDHRKKMNLVV